MNYGVAELGFLQPGLPLVPRTYAPVPYKIINRKLKSQEP